MGECGPESESFWVCVGFGPEGMAGFWEHGKEDDNSKPSTFKFLKPWFRKFSRLRASSWAPLSLEGSYFGCGRQHFGRVHGTPVLRSAQILGFKAKTANPNL